jgi:hypothetical protein
MYSVGFLQKHNHVCLEIETAMSAIETATCVAHSDCYIFVSEHRDCDVCEFTYRDCHICESTL